MQKKIWVPLLNESEAIYYFNKFGSLPIKLGLDDTRDRYLVHGDPMMVCDDGGGSNLECFYGEPDSLPHILIDSDEIDTEKQIREERESIRILGKKLSIARRIINSWCEHTQECKTERKLFINADDCDCRLTSLFLELDSLTIHEDRDTFSQLEQENQALREALDRVKNIKPENWRDISQLEVVWSFVEMCSSYSDEVLAKYPARGSK